MGNLSSCFDVVLCNGFVGVRPVELIHMYQLCFCLFRTIVQAMNMSIRVRISV